MRWSAVGLVVVTAACAGEPNLQPIVQYPRPHCPDAKATINARVKVLTLNMRHDVDQWERRLPLIADEIVRLEPDVMGLQEVALNVDQATVLNKLLVERGHAPYEVFQANKADASGEGLAIMSRWPIAAKESVVVGDARVTLWVRVTHPSGGVFDLYDTHLEVGRDADGEEARDRQSLHTVSFIEKHDECRPAFLTGDFNSQAGEHSMQRFVAFGFDDSFALLNGATPGNTLRITLADGAFEQSPTRRVDFVLARTAGTRTATPTESTVVFKNHDAKGFYPSDHLGVVTTFDLGM